MAAFQSLGYALYEPFGENTRCDLVVDPGGKPTRVQCKTGRLRDGAIVFALCSNYGHHRNPQSYRRDYQGEVDAFAVYCPETELVYLIPIGDLPGRTRAYLRVDPPLNNQAIGVRYAANYVIARIAIEGLPSSSGG
jgi:hypothetical protein